METLTENIADPRLRQERQAEHQGPDPDSHPILRLGSSWQRQHEGMVATGCQGCKPSAPATLAAQAKVEFSSPVPAKSSITDGLVPADENDRSIPYIHWWPKKNTTEWITYTFPESKEIKTSTVYWYDDQPWGGCKVPEQLEALLSGRGRQLEGSSRSRCLSMQAWCSLHREFRPSEDQGS